MKTSSFLFIPMATLLIASSLQAEQSGFITPEQSATLLEKPQAATTTKTAMPTAPLKIATTAGYLGMGFNTVPASIRAHLPNNITAQQGLIVTRFANNSPAAGQGIKLHDVLLSYNGQPIEKPEDFIKKIRAGKAGNIVKFTVLRQGSVMSIPVIMGTQQKKKAVKKPLSAANIPPNANYNGLAIRKIGQDIYAASIGFIGQNGKTQQRSYKGNRMQILQQILQANDLPPKAKQQLLFAVQPKQQQQPAGWSGMPNMPFGNGGNFNPTQFFRGWN